MAIAEPPRPITGKATTTIRRPWRVSGVWATPENVVRFAQRAEALGYGSLWTFQRLLVDAGEPPPPNYRSVLDPLLALTFAAAHTSRIRLGVAVVNLPFLSPAYLAPLVARAESPESTLLRRRSDVGVSRKNGTEASRSRGGPDPDNRWHRAG